MTQTLLDPCYLPLLDFMPAFQLSAETLTEMRQKFTAFTPPLDSEDRTVSVEELQVPSHNGDHQLRVLVYRYHQAAPHCPALLEIHGGGHVLGSADQGDASNRALARMIKGVVVAVSYRLAPETSYPGPVEDCYSALLWLYKQAQNLQIDKHRIGVIGTSAGGGLAACLCLLARDRAVVPVAFQGLIMPMLDNLSVARHQASPNPHVGQYLWTRQNNAFSWQAMLGNIANNHEVSPYAAAARADDVSGLPPTYLGIGALDLFVEETLSYAQRLLLAGVAVDCHVYSGAPHAYQAVAEAEATHNEQRLLQQALYRAFKIN